MWMLRALWLVVAHDLFEYTYMDDVTGKLVFFVSYNMARGFEKIFEIIRIKHVNARQKEFSPTWECLTYKKFLQGIVCHRYERLAVLQNFFVIILLWASEEVGRLFRETDK